MKRALEIAPAIALLAARAFFHPPPRLVVDPVFLLAALWIALASLRDPRRGDGAVLAASLLLFFAYAWQQLPFALDLLRQTL